MALDMPFLPTLTVGAEKTLTESSFTQIWANFTPCS